MKNKHDAKSPRRDLIFVLRVAVIKARENGTRNHRASKRLRQAEQRELKALGYK